MVVYVKTQGARIMREGRHLLVKKGDATYHTLFTYKLKQIVIFGNVDITHAALVQLMRYNIDTVFLTMNGRYLGRIAPPEARNVFLRRKQYRLTADEEFTIRIARSIAAGKLSNMATLLSRIKRERKSSLAGERSADIQKLIEKLNEAKTLESIRGYEGRGSALYFEAFPAGFIENMGFRKRIRRPPTDPVNAVLSLLYTFLMNRVYTAVRVASLDPYPGFLHSLDYGRYSLVLDLMEEFRPIVVDTLTLSLFNLKILKAKDFQIQKPEDMENVDESQEDMPDVSKDPIGLISPVVEDENCFDMPEQRIGHEGQESADRSSGKYPVRLNNDSFRKVIDAFEKKLTTEFYYPPADRRLTYGDVMLFQADHFRRVLQGEAAVYQPLQLK